MYEIEVSAVKSENQTISFYSQEQQEDIIMTFSKQRIIYLTGKHIFNFAIGKPRFSQTRCSESLDETSALITMDWAMKFQCQKYREKQSEWFGKRGLS